MRLAPISIARVALAMLDSRVSKLCVSMEVVPAI